MRRIVLRPAARADLIDIWSYIATNNAAAADRLLDRLEAAFNQLAEMPLMGRSRPELLRDLRSFIVTDYVVFYLPAQDEMDIVRVLSGYRDIGPEHF